MQYWLCITCASKVDPLLTPHCCTLQVAVAADEAAAALESTRREEQELLEKIRAAFSAKSVVRVCSVYDRSKVLAGAQKLLENAETIKSTVSLAGASIAIDDCYEVWGSGFISIPYNFTVQELPQQLVRLLKAGEQQEAEDALEGLPAVPKAERPSPAQRQVVASAVQASATSRGAPLSLQLLPRCTRLLPRLGRHHIMRAAAGRTACRTAAAVKLTL